MFDKVLSNAGNHKIEKIKKTKKRKRPESTPLHVPESRFVEDSTVLRDRLTDRENQQTTPVKVLDLGNR